MASITQLTSEAANDVVGVSLSQLFNTAQAGKFDEAANDLCKFMKYDKKTITNWLKEPDDFFTAGDKVTILMDIFIHYQRQGDTTPAKELAYAKLFISIRNSGEIPDHVEGWDDEVMSIQKIFYKALKLQGRKKVCEQNVIKSMQRLIDYEIKESIERRERMRQNCISDIIENVDIEKTDSARLYAVPANEFEDYFGRESILTYKRRMFECAERIANEGLCGEMTPNILDCFNELMQNYMDAMLQKKEGDVQKLSENLTKFYDMIKVVCELTPARKKTTRKRKPKKKKVVQEASCSSEDEEEIVIQKKECQFCGKAISPLANYAECVECAQEGEQIQSKFQ